MARVEVSIDPKQFEAGADKITQAIKQVAQTGQAAGEQLDAAFQDIDFNAAAEKAVSAQRKQSRSAKALERSVRAASDAYKELARAGRNLVGGGGAGGGGAGRAGGGAGGGGAGAGDAFDLSAAFERDVQDIIRNDRHLTSVQQQELNKRVENQRRAFERTDLSGAFERNAQDTIRQDRHLTNLQEQERKTRISNERQGQQEVSRILTSAAKDREAAERASFQRNRQARDANLKQRQSSATNAVDALFTSSNQQNNIRAERAKRDIKIEQDLEKEIKRVTRSASNAFKQQASEINRSRRQIEVGLLELFFTLHSLSKPVSDITNALAAFTAENVKAATQVEKYASTLNIVSGNSATAKRVLDSLLDVTVELAAIDTPGLIQFSARLQHADFTAQQAENAIVAVTKRMEEQGKGAAITNRVLEQFAQAINADLISMQDFRPILREYPGLYKDFSTALGATITDMDSLRAAADQAGGATQAIAIALEHVSTVAQGAELDTINRQLDEFRDRIFNLQRALGDVLLPNLVSLLKTGNRILDFLQNMNETSRVFIQTLALVTLGLGKAVEGFIQLGIISVVIIQLRTAINQINNAAQSLSNLAAVANNTTAAVVALPKDFQRISRVMGTLQRILPAVAIGFTGLLILIPALTAAFAKITQQIRLMREEIKDFDSVQRQIPKSINEGSAAIQSQIKDLREYRLDLQKTRDELENIINVPEQDARFGSFETLQRNIAILTGGADRLSNLDSQIESVTENIRQLLIIGNEDLTLKTRLFELVGVIEDINKQLVLARIDEAFDVEGAEDKTRRLEASLLAAQNAFRTLNTEAGKVDAITNYTEELIKIDFAIRRLERDIGNQRFGNSEKLFNNLVGLLEREATLKRNLAKEEEDNEKDLALAILKINEQLDFDKENLLIRFNERARDLNKTLSENIRQAFDIRFGEGLPAGFQSILNAALALAKGLPLLIGIALRENDKLFQELYAPVPGIPPIFDNILKGAKALANGLSLQIGIALRENDKLFQELYAPVPGTPVNFKIIIDAARLMSKEVRLNIGEVLRENDKLFQELYAPSVGIPAGFQSIIDGVEQTAEQLARTALIQDRIDGISRSIRRFSREFSTLITDLAFDADRPFSEIVIAFAESSARILLQTRIEAEIRKRISDEVTAHEIANFNRRAAASTASGAFSGLSALSPAVALGSGGLGTAALVGLSIAPFLVRAIKDGFDDTSVNIDKREVGKISASGVGRLVREGRVRL